jgi:hypothetical protein
LLKQCHAEAAELLTPRSQSGNCCTLGKPLANVALAELTEHLHALTRDGGMKLATAPV